MEGERSNIIPFRRRGTEYINGIAQPLGQMPLSRLLEVEQDARARVADAQTDLQIVTDYLDRLYPEGGQA